MVCRGRRDGNFRSKDGNQQARQTSTTMTILMQSTDVDVQVDVVEERVANVNVV